MGPVRKKEPWPRFTGSVPFMLVLGVISFVLYAWIWNASYAALICVSLFIHELGHVWALWHYGLKVKGMYAIPLLGAAVISHDRRMPSRMAMIIFALMGPAWGYALAALAYVAYLITSEPIIAGLAAWMAILNLVNLYPLSPLDGGQAWKVIISPLPRPVRIALIVLPLLGVGYLAIRMDGWVMWLLFAVGVLVMAYECAQIHWRKRDRQQVLGRLGYLLILEESSPDMVLTRIDTLLIEIRAYAARRHVHPLFKDGAFNPFLIHCLMSWPKANPAMLQEQAFRLTLTQNAFDARTLWRVRKRTVVATSDSELFAGSPDTPFNEAPLGVYLAGDPMNHPLPPIKAVSGLVGYCLLAFGMFGLLWLTREAPGAFDALLRLAQRR